MERREESERVGGDDGERVLAIEMNASIILLHCLPSVGILFIHIQL